MRFDRWNCGLAGCGCGDWILTYGRNSKILFPTPVYSDSFRHEIHVNALFTWADLVKELSTYRLRIIDDYDSLDDLPEEVRDFCNELQLCLNGPAQDVDATLKEWERRSKEADSQDIPELVISK